METNGAPDLSLQLAAARPRKLSEELVFLKMTFAERAVSLREVIQVLAGRAFDFLLLLLAIPFLLPVPIPGLSTVFGSVIALIAIRQMLGQKPWLPQKLLDAKLPPKFFPAVLGGAGRVMKVFELMLKPRQLWLTQVPLPRLHAFIIFLAAVVLLLPLPPGTNFPPAVCIVLFAGGLMERDGLFVLAGYVAFGLNIVFFAVLAIYGAKLFDAVWHWLQHLGG